MAALCKFFMNGTCAFGEKCSFSHDLSALPSGPRGPQPTEWRPRGRGQYPSGQATAEAGAGMGGPGAFYTPHAPFQVPEFRPSAFAHRPPHMPSSAGLGVPHTLSGPPSFHPPHPSAASHAPIPRSISMPAHSHTQAAELASFRGLALGPSAQAAASGGGGGGGGGGGVQYGQRSRGPLPSFFTSQGMKLELLTRQLDTEKLPMTEDQNIPSEVDKVYHSLVPLEPELRESGLFQYPTMVYKAFNSASADVVALRRLANARLSDQKAMAAVDQWRGLDHPNVISVLKVFTTRDFLDHSVVFVSEYQPCCQSLASRHLSNNPAPEPLLWTYIIQLTAALRAIHAAGLACRAMDPSKILVQGASRIFISGVCVLDVMTYNAAQSPAAATALYQQEDLAMLGRLVVALATGAPFNPASLQQFLTHSSGAYSEDVFNFMRYLLSPAAPSRAKSVHDLMPHIGARFFTEIEGRLRRADAVEADLTRELHNGRLLRLAYKLVFVADRSASLDPRLAATGDRYLLTLFKDYVFHLENEAGNPVADLSHVVQTLNKLELCSGERVLLVSPDQKSIITVTYADLNTCLEKAFRELSKHQH